MLFLCVESIWCFIYLFIFVFSFVCCFFLGGVVCGCCFCFIFVLFMYCVIITPISSSTIILEYLSISQYFETFSDK